MFARRFDENSPFLIDPPVQLDRVPETYPLLGLRGDLQLTFDRAEILDGER